MPTEYTLTCLNCGYTSLDKKCCCPQKLECSCLKGSIKAFERCPQCTKSRTLQWQPTSRFLTEPVNPSFLKAGEHHLKRAVDLYIDRVPQLQPVRTLHDNFIRAKNFLSREYRERRQDWRWYVEKHSPYAERGHFQQEAGSPGKRRELLLGPETPLQSPLAKETRTSNGGDEADEVDGRQLTLPGYFDGFVDHRDRRR